MAYPFALFFFCIFDFRFFLRPEFASWWAICDSCLRRLLLRWALDSGAHSLRTARGSNRVRTVFDFDIFFVHASSVHGLCMHVSPSLPFLFCAIFCAGPVLPERTSPALRNGLSLSRVFCLHSFCHAPTSREAPSPEGRLFPDANPYLRSIFGLIYALFLFVCGFPHSSSTTADASPDFSFRMSVSICCFVLVLGRLDLSIRL